MDPQQLRRAALQDYSAELTEMRAQQHLENELAGLVSEMESRSKQEYETQKALEEAKKQLEGLDRSRLETIRQLKEKEALDLKREQERIARTERAIEAELAQLQRRALAQATRQQQQPDGGDGSSQGADTVEERRRQLALQQGERLAQLRTERARLERERVKVVEKSEDIKQGILPNDTVRNASAAAAGGQKSARTPAGKGPSAGDEGENEVAERPKSAKTVILEIQRKWNADQARLQQLKANLETQKAKEKDRPALLKAEDWENAPLETAEIEKQTPPVDPNTRRRYEFVSAKQALSEAQVAEAAQAAAQAAAAQAAAAAQPPPVTPKPIEKINNVPATPPPAATGNEDTVRELRKEIDALQAECKVKGTTNPTILAAIAELEREALRLSVPSKRKGDKPKLALPTITPSRPKSSSSKQSGSSQSKNSVTHLPAIEASRLQHGSMAASNPLFAQMMAQMQSNRQLLAQQQAENERMKTLLEDMSKPKAGNSRRLDGDPAIRRLIDRVERALGDGNNSVNNKASSNSNLGGGDTGAGSRIQGNKVFSGGDGPNSLFGEIFEEEQELEELERTMDHDSPLYMLRKQHLEQMLKLKYDMQRMKQEAALAKLHSDLEKVKAEHERENWEQEQQRLLLEAKYRRQLAKENVIRAEEGGAQNILSPPGVEYDHEKGFSIFIDWTLGVPARVQQCNVVYAFYAGSAPRTEPKLLLLSDCEHEPSATHARCVFAQKRQFSHVPCNPEFRCLLEIQSISTATANAPPKSSALGWTVLPLFAKDVVALNAGLWRLPCFHPPIRPELEIDAVKRLARVPKLEIFIRIVRAQNSDLHATMPVDIDANAPHYNVAPWLRLESDAQQQQQQQAPPPQSLLSSVRKPPLPLSAAKSTPPPSSREAKNNPSVPRGTALLRGMVNAGNAFATPLHRNNSAAAAGSLPLGTDRSRWKNSSRENEFTHFIVHIAAVSGVLLNGQIRAVISLVTENGNGIPLVSGISVSDNTALSARGEGGQSARDNDAGTWASSVIPAGAAGGLKQRIEFPVDRRGDFRRVPLPSRFGGILAIVKIQQQKWGGEGQPMVGEDANAQFETIAWGCVPLHTHRWSIRAVATAKFIARLFRRKIQQGRLSLTLIQQRNKAVAIVRRREAGGSSAPLVPSQGSLFPSPRFGRFPLITFPAPVAQPFTTLSSANPMDGASIIVNVIDGSAEAAMNKAEGEKKSEERWRQQAANAVSQVGDVDAGEDEEGTSPFILTLPGPTPRSPFALGDGFDIYIDSARFLPDNATFSKVYAFVSSSPLSAGSIYGKIEGYCLASSRDIRSPMYRLRKEFRLVSSTDIFDCTSTMVIQLLAHDHISGCVSVVGFSILNIFVDPLTGKQPVAGTQEFMLNQGCFQLPVHRGGLRPDRVFDASSLDGIPVAPCTTLLVRLQPAPRSQDGLQVLTMTNSRMSDAEAASVGLKIPPPGYKKGKFSSVTCSPNGMEQSLYDRLPQRPKLKAVEAAILSNPSMPSDQIQGLTGGGMADLIVSTMTASNSSSSSSSSASSNNNNNKGPPPIDVRFHTTMVASAGLCYWIESAVNLPKKSLLPFCMSSMPPFNMYSSSGNVTAGTNFHWELDLDSDQRSPKFVGSSSSSTTGGGANSGSRPSSRNGGEGAGNNENGAAEDGNNPRSRRNSRVGGEGGNPSGGGGVVSGGVVCKDLVWSQDRLSSLIVDIRFLVTHSGGIFKRKLPQPTTEAVGFAVLPLLGSKGPYILFGRYQVPVFKGIPPRDLVEQLRSQSCTTVLNTALQQGKIERLQWASVNIRVVDLGNGAMHDHLNTRPNTKFLYDLFFAADEDGPEYESVRASQTFRKLLPSQSALVEAAVAFATACKISIPPSLKALQSNPPPAAAAAAGRAATPPSNNNDATDEEEED